MLGHAALQALQLEVASKAFARVQDSSHLALLHQVEQARKAGHPDAILKADVLAYQVSLCAKPTSPRLMCWHIR